MVHSFILHGEVRMEVFRAVLGIPQCRRTGWMSPVIVLVVVIRFGKYK